MQKFVPLSTGVRMEYVEQGPADGDPLIFLHGVTDSWRAFERVLALLPSTIRAFALSQRGHGDSSRPDAGYTFADMSADVDAFMEAAGVRAATIVGHSMGASVAQHVAAVYPERVARLVLMGAFANYDDPGMSEFYASSIAPLGDPITREFAREWQLSTTARPMDPGHLETVVDETLKVPARVWQAAFAGFLTFPDFSERLRNVTVPALVAWGELDAYAPRSSQERLRDVMPHARFIEYKSAGHAFHWEEPSVFVQDLLAFLDDSRLDRRPLEAAQIWHDPIQPVCEAERRLGGRNAERHPPVRLQTVR